MGEEWTTCDKLLSFLAPTYETCEPGSKRWDGGLGGNRSMTKARSFSFLVQCRPMSDEGWGEGVGETRRGENGELRQIEEIEGKSGNEKIHFFLIFFLLLHLLTYRTQLPKQASYFLKQAGTFALFGSTATTTQAGGWEESPVGRSRSIFSIPFFFLLIEPTSSFKPLIIF